MSKHVKVNVDGYGSYEIPLEHVNELISWLSNKQAVSIRSNNQVQEVRNNNFTGRVLIQE